ncbi:MAG: hypothetical protein EG828_07150 [Deltaproteobacteria bacterium]|nr:hypothetical protein [Deltaproteobacteria bacterium]
MNPALESVMEYLDANGIKYEMKHPRTIWFSLIVPTPETPGTPNRVVSCSIRIPQAVIQTLHFSVAVMAVELSEELFQQVASFFMRYQSTELKIGRIVVQPDGSILYHYSQFLGAGGNVDRFSIAAMITTAIIEISSIFKARDDVIRVFPKPTVPHSGQA